MSEDTWQIWAREKVLSLSQPEFRPARMAAGDRLWIYVNRKWVDRQLPRLHAIRATARVTGEVRRLDRSPWNPWGARRFQRARSIEVESEVDVPARHLLMSMSWTAQPSVWGKRLLAPPFRLTPEDVAKLEEAVR